MEAGPRKSGMVRKRGRRPEEGVRREAEGRMLAVRDLGLWRLQLELVVTLVDALWRSRRKARGGGCDVGMRRESSGAGLKILRNFMIK